ncbi:cell division protein ZapE [Shewanella surugensis]|uniref:AFG1 family ATPase n=1 Tax=Shewanella surugensis TaxID=212020 RepID=A0ABT0LDY1_9GAMM|nr:cell division protein ZapE [Shewanella surugensis]MCL1125913.1 AFG1 family ATPase [Shewanella surugensis]
MTHSFFHKKNNNTATLSTSPLQAYQALLDSRDLIEDPKQMEAVTALNGLYQGIVNNENHHTAENIPKGLYLWGDVGRGKTFLMDMFYKSLLHTPKIRLHFHRFMARIHKELALESGKRDPLKRIAKRIRKEADVLCFDEFFVSDIGDAMILAGLFEALFQQGLILIATSNIPIKSLYDNGLQRQRFMPTIQLLLAHTKQIHLNGEHDHRLRNLQYHQTYFLPHEIDFGSLFNKLNQDTTQTPSQKVLFISQGLLIHGRLIDTIKYSASSLWLSFDSLCDGPRSQLDYIEIASQFTHVLLSNIPVLGGEPRSWIRARGTEDGHLATETGERQLSYSVNDDPARRFISLIDELYDQGVHLYLSAEVPLEQLYTQGALSFEFKRTLSRLKEMQSKEYLT